ncbi:hypothetical protein D9619_008328 [Psilocybe cf. subviscida]|uniref:FAD/NAD(P)-binding domain-containing protein n=1 Tax=Psilocybe cf. subviscida TaxID=2480587 RepID=A0A8H5B9H6_9AGAR|nr:hypothetical protein D9619_008328 [Psilocybe cf. subviscida]
MSKKSDDRKSIVIIGGGSGGAALAHSLSKTLSAAYELILIDPRSNHILVPSTIRLPVVNSNNLEDAVLIPFNSIFVKNNGTFHQASVTSIHSSDQGGGTVTLDNGESIPYDVLVLATGSIWYDMFAFPGSEKELRGKWSSKRSTIKSAKHVVLAGGGAVGVELAGEIRSEYPEKTITIVHSDALLLNNAYPDKFRKAVADGVKAKKINILQNDYIDSTEIQDGRVTTRSGNSVSADLLIRTHGTKPNTGLISQSLGREVLSQSGYVKVRPTLQLEARADIFAVGDIVDFPEQKQALKAQAHAAIVAANILAFFRGGALKDYKGTTNIIVLPIGKEGGLSYLGLLWGITLGDWFTRRVKSQTLLVPTLRKALGLS